MPRIAVDDIQTDIGPRDTASLDALWATLPVVALDELWGAWRGEAVDTGHVMCAPLVASGFYGKTFNSPLDVQPLICLDEDGELFINETFARGGASVWMIEFRGEVTATMVYDGAPTFDHFKRFDDNTLLGCMNGKDKLDNGQLLYFLLHRETHEQGELPTR